jgi:hypothetical protein
MRERRARERCDRKNTPVFPHLVRDRQSCNRAASRMTIDVAPRARRGQCSWLRDRIVRAAVDRAIFMRQSAHDAA